LECEGEFVGIVDVSDVGDADVVFEHDVSEGEEASFDDVDFFCCYVLVHEDSAHDAPGLASGFFGR